MVATKTTGNVEVHIVEVNALVAIGFCCLEGFIIFQDDKINHSTWTSTLEHYGFSKIWLRPSHQDASQICFVIPLGIG